MALLACGSLCWVCARTCRFCTAQNFSRAVNFVDFAVSLNYYHENKWMASHMAIYYACDPRICYPQNQDFNKSTKFIAHEIFVLYSTTCRLIYYSLLLLLNFYHETGL